MTLNEYQLQASSTAIYPSSMLIVYPTLGLCGETGEVADKIKKVYRDKGGDFSKEDTEEIVKELGDVLWYIANLSQDLGVSLEEIAKKNIKKILNRKNTGTLHGSGDNR